MSHGMLDESQCWRVSGVRTAKNFFRALSILVPDATHMFLEGSPDPDIETVLTDAADEADYAAPVGTIWSWPAKNRRFSVRASPELFARLSEASSNHAEPEICDHVHLYRDQEALVQWFDAFLEPLLVSKSVARERVQQFASAIGATLSEACPVKRQFGGPVRRLLRGGTTLSDTEHAVLCSLVNTLPPDLRTIVTTQFNSYNLVQREIDGRALNFYRFKNGSPAFTDDLPQLHMKTEESPLIRATLSVEGEPEPLHAVLAAVRGRVFCVSFSRAPSGAARSVRILETEQSWRSSIVVGPSVGRVE